MSDDTKRESGSCTHITLRRGAVHEWMFPSGHGPALCVLAHLARRAAEVSSGLVVWIGRSCWPYPRVMMDGRGRGRRLLERSIFVDPPDRASRLWAIDVALRGRAVAAVIADAGGMDMASSRRLQLAAEAGRAIGLLVRPEKDGGVLSAAATRWVAAPALSATDRARWVLELVRVKGGWGVLGGGGVGGGAWAENLRVVVEWDRENGAVAIPADVVGGSGQTQRAKTERWRGVG